MPLVAFLLSSILVLSAPTPVLAQEPPGPLEIVLRDSEVVIGCTQAFVVEGSVINLTVIDLQAPDPRAEVSLWTTGDFPVRLASNETGGPFHIEAQTPSMDGHFVYRVEAVEHDSNRTANHLFHVWAHPCPTISSPSVPSVMSAILLVTAAALWKNPRMRGGER
jgi:hypothetical protein